MRLYEEFTPSHFRHSLLINIKSAQVNFVENNWVGHALCIGNSVRLKIDAPCPLCVVTTLAQAELPQDLNILKTTAQYNNIIAGIRLLVIQGAILFV